MVLLNSFNVTNITFVRHIHGSQYISCEVTWYLQWTQTVCCLSQLVIASALLWQHSVAIPYIQHCISWQIQRCNCPFPAAQDETRDDHCCRITSHSDQLSFILLQSLWPRKSVYMLTHAYVMRLNIHSNTHLLIGGYLVKNTTWNILGSSEQWGDTSSSVSPQGHSLQAAAVAAIMALHLPAPFNWLMLFDMSERSSQLASGRLQLGPGLNAAENFARPWYDVTARLKSIRRTCLKAAVLNPPHTVLLESLEMGVCRLGVV